LAAIALVVAVLRMTDEEYFALGYLARTERMVEVAPRWYQAVTILMQVWIWSEFLTMMFNKKRRAIHDFIAGTVVLKGRRPNSAVEGDASDSVVRASPGAPHRER